MAIFADEFEPLKVTWPPAFEARDETYIVCPDSNTRLAICDNRLAADRLDEHRGSLELWSRTLDAAFPLCQRDVRDALRQFPVAVPSLYRPEYDAFAFVTDVAGCTDGLRVVGVRGVRRRIAVGDCTLERSVFSVAGRTFQSLAVYGPDPESVRSVLFRFGMDRFDPQNIVTLLKQVVQAGNGGRIPPGLGDFSLARPLPLLE